jgi:hypothetical protein
VVPHSKEDSAVNTQLITTTMSSGNEWKQYTHCSRTQELDARGRISKPQVSLQLQLLQVTWEVISIYYCKVISRKIVRAAYFTRSFQKTEKLCLSDLVWGLICAPEFYF